MNSDTNSISPANDNAIEQRIAALAEQFYDSSQTAVSVLRIAFAEGIAIGVAQERERASRIAATKFQYIHTYASENSDRYIAMRDAGRAIANEIESDTP